MPRRRPNFIVFYLDDLGYGDLGCYGSDAIRTPHIDALAAGGIRFTNWYSNSPVCSPSRAALLTGRYPMRAGVPHILGGRRGTPGLPPTERTLASYLGDLGYRTAIVGKWHLGVSRETSPLVHGFDEFFGFRAGCVDYFSHIFYWQQVDGVNPVHDLWDGEREVWRNGRYLTELITERAIEYLGRQVARHAGGDPPFFLYVPYNAPHYPMHAPTEYVDRYRGLAPDRRIMAAMVGAVDDGVGAIMEALRRHGLDEDTLVFFSADNGPSTESRNWLDGTEDFYYGGSAGIFRGHKGSLFEGGIREPAILSWPGTIPGGRTSDETCATFDILPTFLDLAGGERPRDRIIDGASLAPHVLHGAPGPHETLFWEYGKQLAVRRGRWKLVLDGKLDFARAQADPVHLSDLAVDPGERANLAAQERGLADELARAAREWYAGLVPA